MTTALRRFVWPIIALTTGRCSRLTMLFGLDHGVTNKYAIVHFAVVQLVTHRSPNNEVSAANNSINVVLTTTDRAKQFMDIAPIVKGR